MLSHSKMPYSQKGLEDLAAALNVHSAALWFSPAAGRVEIKAHQLEKGDQIEEELECEQ